MNIAPGSAADSTGSTTITIPAAGCSVNLGMNGLNGLDANSVMPSTTYYFFIVTSPASATTSCMASTSQTPSFAAIGSGYEIDQPFQTAAGSTTIFNVGQSSPPFPNPLSGMAIGDPIKDNSGINTYIPTNTTIVSLQSFSLNQCGSVVGSGPYYVSLPSVAGVEPGMNIAAQTESACVGAGTMPPGTTITAVSPTGFGSSCSGPCVQISGSANIVAGTAQVWISGGYTIGLSNNATGNTVGVMPLPKAKVAVGLYRMIGALYTTAVTMPTPTIVSFHQDNDTFYLDMPALDINSAASTQPPCNGPFKNSLVYCVLSVPNGLKVEAFGRIVGGSSSSQVLISSYDQVPGATSTFPGPPGYAIQSYQPDTAYPFRAYTSTAQQVKLRASSSTATIVYEDTDGWVWKRAQ